MASEPSLPLLPLLFPKEDQLVPSSAALPSIKCKNRKIEENAQQLLAVQHIVAGLDNKSKNKVAALLDYAPEA